MKKTLICAIAAIAALALSSCRKEESRFEPENHDSEETTMVTVRIGGIASGIVTKGGPEDVEEIVEVVDEEPVEEPVEEPLYIAATEAEKAVKDLQILVFDEGVVEFYLHPQAPSSLSNANYDIPLKLGKKKIYAVANGPDFSQISTQGELDSTSVELGTYNVRDSCLIMVGFTNVEIKQRYDKVDCQIMLSRLVGKYYIARIINDLSPAFGAATLKYAFIANAVGNQTINGRAPISLWYNKFGRADENPQVESHIIDGVNYMASAPRATFYKWDNVTLQKGDTSCLEVPFYAYPNLTSSSYVTNGFNPPFTQSLSKLVLAVEFENGGLNYYCIEIRSCFFQNTASAIFLTLIGPGSNDPDNVTEKGSIKSMIKVDDWHSNNFYEEKL